VKATRDLQRLSATGVGRKKACSLRLGYLLSA